MEQSKRSVAQPIWVAGRCRAEAMATIREASGRRCLLKRPGESTPGRNRTCDLRFRKPLLYPLSYRPQTVIVLVSRCFRVMTASLALRIGTFEGYLSVSLEAEGYKRRDTSTLEWSWNGPHVTDTAHPNKHCESGTAYLARNVMGARKSCRTPGILSNGFLRYNRPNQSPMVADFGDLLRQRP